VERINLRDAKPACEYSTPMRKAISYNALTVNLFLEMRDKVSFQAQQESLTAAEKIPRCARNDNTGSLIHETYGEETS
jgi:hypothetical protein